MTMMSRVSPVSWVGVVKSCHTSHREMMSLKLVEAVIESSRYRFISPTITSGTDIDVTRSTMVANSSKNAESAGHEPAS